MLYLAVSEHAISAVLTREENRIQYPIYCTSKVLYKVKLRYFPLEKLAYVMVMTARKLRPYFLEHPIEPLTNFPLRQTLRSLTPPGG